MKTATQIENIIAKLRSDLEDVRARIDDIRTWANAGNFMQEKEFHQANGIS